MSTALELQASTYARHRKDILNLIKKLEGFGAQADLDLPRITVIGNQSAGKSSVIEGISGISVPRDPGTCTRSPMECRMTTSSGSWSARILIRTEYDDLTRRALLQVTETPFGEPIKNKDDLAFALRRAQFAVLNPSVSKETILEAQTKEQLDRLPSARSLPFSRNVVCVELEGPELTDLSFIDLPGLVQNADPYIVQMVEDMVNSYIGGNSIILVVIPMTDDIENQKALRLAHNKDPEGRRTIGVLTKADMLLSASNTANQWLDILEGRQHKTLHGYYATRQPTDDERSRNIPKSQARDLEAAFFSETAPWAGSSDPQRFGTANLIATLSRLLVHVINEKLPEIHRRTAQQLQDCRERLDAIPGPVSEQPTAYLLSTLTEFCNDLQPFIQGGVGTAQLIHTNMAAYQELRNAVRITAPNFVPFAANERTVEFVNSLDEDGEEQQANVASASGAAVPIRFDVTQMKKHIGQSITRELPNNVPFDAKVALITQFQRTWPASVKRCFNKVERAMLDLLLQQIETKFGRFNVLQSQLRSLVKELVLQRRVNCNLFLDAMLETENMPFTQNTAFYKSITEKWTAKYRKLREPSDPLPVSTESSSTEPPASTSTRPALFNFSTPANSSRTIFSDAARNAPGNPSLTEASTTNGGFGLNTSPFVRLTPSPTPSATGNGGTSSAPLASLPFSFANIGSTPTVTLIDPKPNEYETELIVMAEVRAYFQLAHMRIIDNVPALIDLKFVRALGKELQSFLVSKFEIGNAGANERCARILSENPAVVAQRDELLARKRRLEKAESELNEFSLDV